MSLTKRQRQLRARTTRNRRRRRAAAGLCANCPNPRTPTSKRYCATCLYKITTLVRERVERLLREGLCVMCGKLPIDTAQSKRLCAGCRNRAHRHKRDHDARAAKGTARTFNHR